MDTFLADEPAPEVALLYGVRRTGKTTGMLQAILNLPYEERKKAVFFQIRKPGKLTHRILPGDTVEDLQNDIERLIQEGKKYFLVDEATRLIDFQHGADIFSDVLAMLGGKIVLTGTDSLCLDDARRDVLQGRAFPISTSHIFFAEWSAISGLSSVDDFAKQGGILGKGRQIQQLFGSTEGCEEYIQSAYAANLAHSIKERKFTNIPDEILDLADEGRLESAVQRVVENLNHRVTARILRKNLSLSSIGSLKDLIEKDVIRAKEKGFSVSELITKRIQLSAIQGLHEEQLIQWMSLCLHIRDESIYTRNMTIDGYETISQEAAYYLEKELVRLDILSPFIIRKIYEDGSISDSKRNLLVQHGLKYCQEKTMAECLSNDVAFSSLFNSDKDSLLKRMEQDILGHIIEEIVLLDTKKAFECTEVKLFTLGLAKGEIDLAVLDDEAKALSLFEIKHSSSIDPGHQACHLMDKQTLSLIQKVFGDIKNLKRTVLINNNNWKEKIIDGIIYKDIGEFLLDMYASPRTAVFGCQNIYYTAEE